MTITIISQSCTRSAISFLKCITWFIILTGFEGKYTFPNKYIQFVDVVHWFIYGVCGMRANTIISKIWLIGSSASKMFLKLCLNIISILFAIRCALRMFLNRMLVLDHVSNYNYMYITYVFCYAYRSREVTIHFRIC